MLGWCISVYRHNGGGRSPATSTSGEGKRLAVWQTGLGGLDWLNDLVEAGNAIDLGGDGYPCRYTATAVHLIPPILNGPSKARSTWVYGVSDVLTDTWAGKTVIDRDAAAECRDDEWLLVEAWDES